MFQGATRGSVTEEWLGFAQPRLLVSRRLQLQPATWQFDICSPFWRLYVQDRPGARIETAGQWVSLDPGYVYVLPAWLRFRTAVTGAVRQDYQHFEFHGFYSHFIKKRCNRPLGLPLDPVMGRLAEHWGQGLDERGEPTPAAHGWGLSFLNAVMAMYLEQLSEDDRQAADSWRHEAIRLVPALSRLEQPGASPSTIGELASLCGFSATHFNRLFRASTGMSPAQYRLQRQVQVAARYLVASDDRIEDIALQVGFSDRYHFTKVFNARIGFPPAAYRSMHR